MHTQLDALDLSWNSYLTGIDHGRRGVDMFPTDVTGNDLVEIATICTRITDHGTLQDYAAGWLDGARQAEEE